MISLRITKDDVSPALALLAGQAKRPRALFAAAGRAVANLFKSHLRMLDRTRPNKLAGRRTHMWNEFARSVSVPSITDTSASVLISDPRAAHKHTGGRITAKRAKFLTIPVVAEAHGRTARTLESELGIKLFVLGTGESAGLFGQLPGKGIGIQKYYALKASVDQPPDPPEGILPEDAEIKRVALAAGAAALQRQLKT